jgi:hypothetical protein
VATRVRTLACLTLASLSLIGCTAPVEAESLELVDPPSKHEDALPSWSHVPDAAAQPVDPDSQPRLVLTLGPAGSEDMHESFCPYQVGARNFPAIDVEGTTLVRVDAQVSGASEGEDEALRLTYVTPEQGQRAQTIYDRKDDFDRDGTAHCDAALAKLREDLDTFNAELAARTWRPLERLDVVPSDSYFRFVDWREPIEALPLDQRPVEVLYRGGYFIARVRQAKVLLELARPHWQRDDAFCQRNPRVNAVEVDRISQLALVYYDHESGACLCYPDEYVDVVRLPSSLLAEVDRRPTAVLEAPSI